MNNPIGSSANATRAENNLFVAAYDDRAQMPAYFAPFIKNTTFFCDLNLLTLAHYTPDGAREAPKSSPHVLRIVDLSKLPQYQYVKSLFDSVFVNYSTNPDAFERACFHRWFALNAATISLRDNDYVCLLDTDFLIGMDPFDVLSLCQRKAGGASIQLVAEWQGDMPVAIGPEITIMTKSFLYGFCEFLLTTYFSLAFKPQLVREYFGRIGNGLPGGICDMRALAAYVKEEAETTFNLQNLGSPAIIGSLSSFLASDVGTRSDWKILFRSDRQILQVANDSQQLIGTHFQGGAKMYMPLARDPTGMDCQLTRAICLDFQNSSAKTAMANKRFIHRAINRMTRAIRGRHGQSS